MDLHIFFLPFLAPGHMIPMVDLAGLLADRGAKATIITTTENVRLIRPTIDLANSSRRHQIQLLSIPFPYSESGVLEGHENMTTFSNPDIPPEFYAAVGMLETPFMQLAKVHLPDCIISDIFYTWSGKLALELGIPRLAFHGTSFFTNVLLVALGRLKPHENVSSDEQPFVVPEIPHRIEMTRSQLPDFVRQLPSFAQQMADSNRLSYGMVMNSFYEMEHDYIERLKERAEMKLWHVGPVSLYNRDLQARAVRGDEASVDCDRCLSWLDAKKPSSVLYLCFGSLGRFTRTQLCEIASGLEASEHPFIWVVRYHGGEFSEWLPEGFEERVIRKGRGLMIGGWAPQLVILNHEAVGGFVTHCGWNSCMEGASAGVPMITWPLFAEQFVNEKLIVDVLKIGIAIGVKICHAMEGERTMVSRGEIRTAVKELMGRGEEADGRRQRAWEIGKLARRAVEEGGSSYNDLSRLIEDLLSLKASKIQSDKAGK